MHLTSLSGDILACIFLHLFLFLCFSGNVAPDKPTEFDFGTVTLTSLKLLGDAHWTNGSVRLTRDLGVPNSGAGKVLYCKPIRFRSQETHIPASFTTYFTFSVSNLNPDSIGGGLAFVISPDDDTVGDAGGYIGIMAGAGSPKSVIAVEFDTLMDVEFKDINGNHVGLDLNSIISSQVGDLDSIEVDLKSGDLVNSWIDYSASTQLLNVSVSYSNVKPKEPILSYSIDLDQYVNDFMFVGFTGSTQGSTEIHSIGWWSFSSSFDPNVKNGSLSASVTAPPPPTATLMNPTANSIQPGPSLAPTESSNSNVAHDSDKSNKKCHNRLCKESAGALVGVFTAGAFVLALFALVLIWGYSKKFKRVKKSESLASYYIKMPKAFSYKQLKLATKCFDSTRIIGHGAFGDVYKGIFAESGDVVAVKRCNHSGQGNEEFFSELSMFGTLRHRNLVRLQGWCHEKGEILLVYDYMANGSLDKALYESKATLQWAHRRKILLGVASALAYLHQECENQVIHRDVKTSNIMLDEAFNAKLGDFGLARQTEHDKSPDATVAAGTMGYLAPEYLLTGRANEKTDVFSFGAVVLEVATGRRPIERPLTGMGKAGTSSNLVEWVWGLHRESRLLAAADPRLCGEFEESEMRKVLLVGLACSHPDPMARPTMRGVVQMLVGESQVPTVPRSRPSMSFSTSHLLLNLQDSVSDLNEMITVCTSSSSECSYNHGSTSGVVNLV
ncbi:L-type lectin-domain containing receptor kinase VIII.1 [Daucus carota subsp. sativus]|uniref:L-type lectin-domain containing receptor kinase VIII.1 n=1 Tax=Daucus carota subsp. sativus TaxID=79200 RepID=UPI0007EF83DD|nr:PREDICTED: L-type lectin-domain containing receptor kinase VIII.1-like [Daucus carota subsp. sativus]